MNKINWNDAEIAKLWLCAHDAAAEKQTIKCLGFLLLLLTKSRITNTSSILQLKNRLKQQKSPIHLLAKQSKEKCVFPVWNGSKTDFIDVKHQLFVQLDSEEEHLAQVVLSWKTEKEHDAALENCGFPFRQ